MSQPEGSPVVAGLDKIFRTALVLIPIGVLGNIAFSLLTTEQSVFGALGDRPLGYLLLAIALGLLPWLTNALRLLIWTRFLGHALNLREAFRITLAMDLGAAVSPTAVGGGIFKWGMLVQRGVSPGAAASLVTLPSFEDGLFFALALPTAVLLTASWDLPVLSNTAARLQEHAVLALLATGGIALFTWLAVRWILRGGLGTRARQKGLRLFGRVRRKLRTTWLDARQVFRLVARDGKSRFALTMTLTAIQWSARYSVISALIAFLGAPVHPVLFWVFQWVVFTLMTFVPTPGAAGGAEAAFFLIYSAFLPTSIIGLATAGWRFLTFYFQLGLAAIVFSLLGLRERSRRTSARTPT